MGHIDAVAFVNERVVTAIHLPQWLCDQANETDGEPPIFLFELCAEILIVFVVNQLENNGPRPCVLCVDNQSAVAALAKGRSTAEMGTVLVNLFATVSAHGGGRWWIEYVNTKSHDADLPSRYCDGDTEEHCRRSNGKVPAAFAETFRPRGHLRREATVFNN